MVGAMTKQTSNAGADSSVDTLQDGKLQRHAGTQVNPADGAGGSDSQLPFEESESDDQPLSLIAQARQENSWWDAEAVKLGLPSSVGSVGSTEGTVSVNPLREHQPGDFHEVEGNEASDDEVIAWPPFVGDPFSGNRPSSPREFSTRRSSSTNSPPSSLFPRTGEIGERTMGD